MAVSQGKRQTTRWWSAVTVDRLTCMVWEAPFGQELWEHQGRPLTVRELRLRLAEAPDPDAPVLLGFYGGSSVVLHLPVDVSAETDGAEWRVVVTGGHVVEG